jgi:GT2 family glycosyltransferase
MKEIVVVIPTLFASENLKKCLDLLFESLKFFGKKQKAVVVIDNGGKIDDRFYSKEIVVIKNQKNLGFAAAVNQGIKKILSRYYLILNDDCLKKTKKFLPPSR